MEMVLQVLIKLYKLNFKQMVLKEKSGAHQSVLKILLVPFYIDYKNSKLW